MLKPLEPPTVHDPVIVTARDGTLFVCWTENVGGKGLRWVYVSVDQVRYDGGIYAGEVTMREISARVDDWWVTQKAIGRNLS